MSNTSAIKSDITHLPLYTVHKLSTLRIEPAMSQYHQAVMCPKCKDSVSCNILREISEDFNAESLPIDIAADEYSAGCPKVNDCVFLHHGFVGDEKRGPCFKNPVRSWINHTICGAM